MIDKLLKEASLEAVSGVTSLDGGPFGAIITDTNGNIVARAHNCVLSKNDPTAHAEVEAIRKACQVLKTHDLSGYIIFSSCEPCPMCLSAIIWSNLSKVYFGANRKDAAAAGFRDDDIYHYFSGDNSILSLESYDNIDCKKILNDYKGEIY